MAKYEFTVRAEDDQGAFADRTFNIEVQNNLVDRIAFSNGTDIYSSIDGKTWTERLGKGGDKIYHINGYWLVCDLGTWLTPLRISRDCINWDEFSAIDMKITCNGVTTDITFMYFPHGLKYSYTENGVVYMFGSFNIDAAGIKTFSGILKTSDFINYEVCGYNNLEEDFTTLPDASKLTTGIDYSYTAVRDVSNIIKKDDQYIITLSNDREFLVTSDIESGNWTKIISANAPSLSGHVFPILFNINGFVVVINYNKYVYDAGNYRFAYYWTYDLVNCNDSGYTSIPIDYTYGHTVDYSNGVLCALNGHSLNRSMFVTDDLVNFTNDQYSENSSNDSTYIKELLAAEHYKGEILALDTDNHVFLIDPHTGEAEHISDMPGSNSRTKCSFAVMK